ncbi:RimJ/RimL family protein N-acetyltransferase [Siphonobacter sp. SORGH_AS 1065]|nr:RimJ/RimL family protein N-acetyltransferase [Siphonobacter sp. SORGH_AS_1065]
MDGDFLHIPSPYQTVNVHLQTPRLTLRDLEQKDALALFELDSNPEVMKFLGKPSQSIEESQAMIEYIRAQYIQNGIGRWAVEHRETGAFMG